MSEYTTNELVQSILDQNYTSATEIFNDMVGQKMQDALEQEKIAVAGQIYNGEEPEDDDYVVDEEEVDQQDDADVELDDEDIEEILDDEEDEE